MNIITTELQFARSLSKRKRTGRLILHHTATSTETVSQIHSYHLKKGWAGIGYHYYVRKDGNIYCGRPEDTVGAHAEGNNNDSIGICFEGNFETEIMPEAQKAAGKELIAHLKQTYGITLVQGHRDVAATSCPGKNFPFAEMAKATTDQGQQEEQKQSETSASGIFGTEILVVDGRWGPAVTRRLQQIFDTPVDGKVSHQYLVYKSRNPGLSDAAWEWERDPSGSSRLIEALQQHLNSVIGAGLRVDGHIGPKTIRALQRWMGTAQDGYFSQISSCLKKLQEWANAQT